jgi:hypothetical protein
VDTHSFNLYPKDDKKRRKLMNIGLIDSSSTLSILMKKKLIRQYVIFLNLWMFYGNIFNGCLFLMFGHFVSHQMNFLLVD